MTSRSNGLRVLPTFLMTGWRYTIEIIIRAVATICYDGISACSQTEAEPMHDTFGAIIMSHACVMGKDKRNDC